MTLTIRDDARREIQKDVNALTQSPRHHMIKVERARTYFPIIEKVFEEERVPDDFKYLVLQESALIADAVSVSNAVGFWQFKDFTALEMGLRVDKEVDERLNIVSSTRAAAKYIKKNNFFFNNWVYALQAYQMGAGGVMKSVAKHDSGEKHMEITSNTYWYIKKFLAHKVAFEESVKSAGLIKVVPYENKSDKRLADLAREISVDENELISYNKWAKKGFIPGDRTYTVLIPMKGDGKEILLPQTAIATTSTPVAEPQKVSTAPAINNKIKVNGIAAIKAESGESAAQLAARAGVETSDFAKWNDITAGQQLRPGTYYLLGKKRARASETYHKVLTGENLWLISQQYGLQLKKLKRYNRISSDSDLQPGMTLWLTAMKPRDAGKESSTGEIVQVDNSRSFAWTVNPDEAEANVSAKPIVLDAAVIEESAKPEQTNNSVGVSQSDAGTQPVVSVSPPLDSVGIVNVIVAPVAKNSEKEHVVQAGETLYAIAKQYGIGVMDIVNWNGLNLQEGIKPGQVLKLVDEAAEAKMVEKQQITEIEHVVKSTDTLYSVARKYNVTIKELMEWNNKKDFTLSVGEKLKVRSK